jgi:serine protease DegQ
MGLLATSVHAATLLETMNSEVAALYEKSKDAVVKVHAERSTALACTPFGPSYRIGSGFFLSTNGQFVTAGSLVDCAGKCWIEWRGQKVEAKLLGLDRITNLAVLQAQTDTPTPFLDLGDSNELRVGSMVVAIGYPYDQPSAPVVGFVTGLDISCGKHVFPVSYVRASCRLHPGQGGGPLLNARGAVAGMVLAARSEDQCYALPANAVRKLVADINEYGAPQYGWVGLNVGERRAPGTENWEVYVKEVMTNTPAAQAGFLDRDVLIRICTNEIRRAADVLNTMFYRRCGEKLKMTVIRQSVTQEFTIAVGKRPPEPASSIIANPATPPTVIPAAGTR